MNLLRPEFSAVVAESGVQLVGAFAAPACRPALVRRLLIEPDDRLAALQGVDSPQGAIVFGNADVLPWVDGLIYLRACPGGASVWVPSTVAISVPEELFARALRTAHPDVAGPVVALPGSRCLIPVAGALALTRAHLQAWKAPS